MKTTIYYFTGTGNSLKVAKDLASRIPDCEVIRIHSASIKELKESPEGRIGFVFPVYYISIPKLMEQFIKTLSMKNNSYVFALITCGGSVGPAMRQLEKLILEKGLKLSAGYGVIMPDNYIVFYNPPTQDSISLMFEREEEMIKEVAETVLNNAEHSFSEDLNLIGRLFGPLAARTFQPKNRDRHFWLEDTCNGCGTCAKLCPVDNIIFRESRPIWLHQCEQCFACIHSCPKRAIQYKQGTLKKGRYCNPKIRLQELYISKD